MELTIGQKFLRPCAVVRMSDGREYKIPVFDHLHADPQFGFVYEHYHIDGRFEIHPRIAHEYNLANGYTASVIKKDNSSPEFLRIGLEEVLCVRLETGLSFPCHPNERQQNNLALYKAWYSKYLGKSCAGKRCPHYGTEMLEQGGKLICPMHHLTADAKTLLVIPINTDVIV